MGTGSAALGNHRDSKRLAFTLLVLISAVCLLYWFIFQLFADLRKRGKNSSFTTKVVGILTILNILLASLAMLQNETF